MTAEQIAAGLTKAHTAVLLSAMSYGKLPLPYQYFDLPAGMARIARDGSLWEAYLTPLGLEVRRILQETHDD